MYTTDQKATGRNLKHASGEELLLLAVFGSQNTKSRIDKELDRRALACVPVKAGVIGHPSAQTPDYGYAA